MAGVGIDIKEVLAEVGVAFKIKRGQRSISGEYLKYVPNSQVTKPFIREFFLEAMISYDTKTIPGDVIEMTVVGDYFMIMNKTPYILENEIIRYDIVLYKTNVQIDIERPSEVRSAQTYHRRTVWERIKTAQHALLTEPLFGASLETDQVLGLIGLERGELYIPSSYGIHVLDRVKILGTTEFYRTEVIKRRRYKDIDVIELGEDVRPTTTTSTTTSTTTTTGSTVSTSSSTTTTTA